MNQLKLYTIFQSLFFIILANQISRMQNLEEYMLPCLNKKLFGLDCMGCGMQRSIALLIKGELIEAFNMYPAIYTLILLFGAITFNTFKNFKYDSKIILILAVLNGIIIVSSFIIKTFF